MLKFTDKIFKDNLKFYVFRDNKGERPEHIHDFIELIYIENGTGIHKINSEKFKIELGDIFVINSGEIHSFFNTINLKLINVLISKSFFRREFYNLKKIDEFWDIFLLEPFFREEVSFSHRLKLNPRQSKEIEPLLIESISELKNKFPGYKIFVKAKIIEFIVKLCRFYSEFQGKEKIEIDMLHKRNVLFEVLEFISTKYLDKINLKDLASVMHLRPDYFCKVFKKNTGKTPMEYIIEYRINKACEYLINTNMNITTIGFEVGFNDSSYFAEKFLEIKGISPSQFRKKSHKITK